MLAKPVLNDLLVTIYPSKTCYKLGTADLLLFLGDIRDWTQSLLHATQALDCWHVYSALFACVSIYVFMVACKSASVYLCKCVSVCVCV